MTQAKTLGGRSRASSAAEFNTAVREGIDPLVRPMGYAFASKTAPNWTRKTRQDRTSVRFSRHPNAVDPYQGGRFSIEFEHATAQTAHLGLNGRAFFDQLLTQPEVDYVLEHQNRVISSLPHPPSSHVAIYPESLRETYLQGFRPEGPFEPGSVQLRYLNVDDLVGWISLITPLLPEVLARAVRLDPTVIYLASPIDLDASPLRPTRPVVLKNWGPS